MTVAISPISSVVDDQVKAVSRVDSATVEQLILTHRETGRKFGRTVLRKWGAQMSDDEFESAVDLAICEAARSYSPEQGASFSTFLFYYVRGTLIKVIKSSVTARKVARAAFFSVAGNELTKLDFEENAGNETPLKDLEAVESREYESPEERALRFERIRLVRESLEKLGENERRVLTSLYHEGKTPNEMVREFGWSRQFIARVKNQGIQQLKRLLAESHGEAHAAPVAVEQAVLPTDRRTKSAARRRRLAAIRATQTRPIVNNYPLAARYRAA